MGQRRGGAQGDARSTSSSIVFTTWPQTGRISNPSLLVVRCLARAAPVVLIECKEESLPCLLGPERPGFPRAAPVRPKASDNRERGPQRLVHLITSQTVQSVR